MSTPPHPPKHFDNARLYFVYTVSCILVVKRCPVTSTNQKSTADCYPLSFVDFDHTWPYGVLCCCCPHRPWQDLSSAVLRAAMSGLLLVAPRAPSSRATNTPASSAAETGFDIASNSTLTSLGDGHAHSPQWDEAFLGLLSVAVWKLPSVRRALLTFRYIGISSSPDGHSADASLRQETRTGETDTIAAVAAVFRRLYHPQPSVRRLASRIAIRLAFDPPLIFSPMISLHGVSTPYRGGDRNDRTRVGSIIEGLQFGAVEERDIVDVADHRGGGDIKCCGCLALEGLNVPLLVLKAYPRVTAWAVNCSCRGEGSEAGNDLALTLTADKIDCRKLGPGCNIPREGKRENKYCMSGNGQRERLLCLDLAADQWRVLCRRRERLQQGSDEHYVEAGVAGRVLEVGEALGGASRRSEFSSAMAVARAWMLAGDM